jgi:hypothetical protein
MTLTHSWLSTISVVQPAARQVHSKLSAAPEDGSIEIDLVVGCVRVRGLSMGRC